METEGQPPPDALAPSEVDRLLVQVTEQDAPPVVHGRADPRSRHARASIQTYDFRHPTFVSAGELRRLKVRHEEFVRSLAARLSIYFRLEFGLQMARLQTVTYQRFVESLASPTHLVLFKLEPLRGICILDINPRLGLTVVDRLLGGPAQQVAAARDLSEIETALLDQVVQLIVGEWCNLWSGFQDLRPTVLGHENSGRFLQTAPHDTIMLSLGLEARLGDCMEQIQIAFPCYTLEPIIRQLGEELEAEAVPHAPTPPIPLRWNRELEAVPLTITAGWENLEIMARQLARLKPGDVLQMGADSASQVRIRLAGQPKFTGTLGTRGKRWAVCVNRILKP